MGIVLGLWTRVCRNHLPTSKCSKEWAAIMAFRVAPIMLELWLASTQRGVAGVEPWSRVEAYFVRDGYKVDLGGNATPILNPFVNSEAQWSKMANRIVFHTEGPRWYQLHTASLVGCLPQPAYPKCLAISFSKLECKAYIICCSGPSSELATMYMESSMAMASE